MTALLLVAVAGSAFATSGPLARWASPLHPLVIVLGRVLLAALFLVGAAPRETVASLLRMTARGRLALLGSGAILAAHFGLFTAGLQATSLPAAVTLVSLEPLS